MLSFKKDSFDYEPCPICYIANILDDATYTQMCAAYPPLDLFLYKPGLGHKYSLSEINKPKHYETFIASQPVWREFHRYIKAPEFTESVLAFLANRNIDLGLTPRIVTSSKSPNPSWYSRLTGRTELSARFEFSMMGPQGGHIRPHTDGPNKLVTLVISMMPEGEWDERWGGATQVCLPYDRTKVYNHQNRYMEFADVDVIKTFPFKPNQCVLFVKTYNSWHQVSPIEGTERAPMRKTITINIERKALSTPAHKNY
jgi:hypothetical protein